MNTEKNIKIKPLTKEQIIISLDRLTRFKNTGVKYRRVFCDLITHNLISPKFRKSELEVIEPEILRNYAQDIINFSIAKYFPDVKEDLSINDKLIKYENKVFLLDYSEEILLKNQINYNACLQLINENSVNNLRWLKDLAKVEDVKNMRRQKAFEFPVELVLIVEGATEEILLPEFAKVFGFDFAKNGIHVISAGGKNQVVKLYYELIETLKLPIFVLLDKDGASNSEEIKRKIRKIDNLYILKSGEFEDLLPFELVKKTLNYELKNISILEKEIFESSSPRVEFLEEVFKKRGLHEFKKVDFAKMVKKHVQNSSIVSGEIEDILLLIKNSLDNKKIQ